MRRFLPGLILICSLVVFSASAQELDIESYRTYDGTQNNKQNTKWGSAGDLLQIMVPLSYSDGMAAPAGLNRPNPRKLSNEIFAQNRLLNDPLKLSDFCWVWGQFLDHDIGITPDGNEFFPISVPKGDVWFDPHETGAVIIPMMRNRFDPSTGTSIENPRRHPNLITAFIDGSGVYGSDKERADWLRTFEDGKLKVSSGNMLPFNTTTGEMDGAIEEHAPEMDNATGMSDKWYVAGDVRANENTLLLSFHTLFVREHNRLAEELKEEHPDWNDEQLYQHARKIVGGLIQAVVYNEYLPAMGVQLNDYTGYNSSVNPQLANIFTAAAFRLGHTLLNGNIMRMMNDGSEHPEGPMTLREIFFNPMVLAHEGSIDPFLKGMGAQMQQEMDARVIDDVRNFLFGPPGAGGLDLASINITRGRERGLPDFNSVRRALGLQPYSIFRQINLDDIGVTYDLLTNYLNINNVDPWVGMLAEKRMSGALFGETIMEIMVRQFTALRDGDRFYYMNDPILSEEEKDRINKTTLHDIIMRNTGITLMQDDVFAALPHEEICENMTVDVFGGVYTEQGLPVPLVDVNLSAGNAFVNLLTGVEGRFNFNTVPGCSAKTISLGKTDDHSNGLSTLDLILVQKHILARELLDSPYKIMAADVDNSGNVSTRDMIKMRKVILSIDTELNDDGAWEFVPGNFVFTSEDNPFLDELPSEYTQDGVGQDFGQDFIAVKLGDVNGSVDLGSTTEAQALLSARTSDKLSLQLQNVGLFQNETYEIPVIIGKDQTIAGYQFGLRFNPKTVEVLDILMDGVLELNESNFAILNNDGLIATSWNELGGDSRTLEQGDKLFTLVVSAKDAAQLSEVMYLDQRNIQAEAYNAKLRTKGLELVFEEATDVLAQSFEVFQNQPNPFSSNSLIPFYLKERTNVSLDIFDASGQTVMRANQPFTAGYNEWSIDRSMMPAAGVYYYRLSTAFGAATRKMIVTD